MLRARGGKGVREVECGDGTTVECDLLVTATGWTAPTSLLNMAGDKPVYSPKAARFFPSELPDNVLATGRIVGDGTLDELLDHARATGEEAARRAARIGAALRAHIPQAVDTEAPTDDKRAAIPELLVHEHPKAFPKPDARLRGLLGGRIFQRPDRGGEGGLRLSELAKRYTTATMGPTQASWRP